MAYTIDVCNVWLAKGYQDSVRQKTMEISKMSGLSPDWDYTPDWITKELCESHQSNLIRKYPEHYRPIFGPAIPDNIPYVWPFPEGLE